MMQTGPIVFRFNGFFGVPVEVGQTLVFLVLLLVGLSLSGGANLVWLALLVAMLVSIIYLHELGHAWAARVQGVPVARIVLHGGGGFMERARSASAHEQEFIVAMGPLVNLALWALASVITDWLGGGGRVSVVAWYYMDLFARLNLMFFLFNLIPVQPLDGGRLLQLLLLRVTTPRVAMRITGGIGLVFAILWWPALIWVWLTYGWLLLFLPSIALHWRMMRGDLRL